MSVKHNKDGSITIETTGSSGTIGRMEMLSEEHLVDSQLLSPVHL